MGFDNECIQNIQSLAGEYFCPVCRLLVYPNEALQSQCTHLYCKPCLAYIANSSRACPYDGYLVTEADSKPLIESNKALAETINKIAVHCLYHRSGCTWEGPLSECITHCSGCAFGNSPVVCNRCGIQIVHRQVQDHAQSCPGVQPQAQKTVPSHEATAASSAATNPSQIGKPAGPASSQTQTSKAVNEAAVTTPELWYQQQYHQYYQQYAGYGTYNPQYQQYYPHQQQQEAVQPQPYPQSQPQVQPQMPPQSQLQGPVLSQLKQQPPSNVQHPTPPPQPQAQAQPHGQYQVNMQLQAQTQVPAVPASLPPNHQQQLQSTVLPYPQPNMQIHPPQTQFNPPHSHLLQHPQIPTQTTMQLHSQPPVHYPPPHPQPLPNSHAQPLSQAQPHGSAPQPQVLHHMHHSQPNPPANALSQPQVQSVPAVPGYQSHPPPLPSSQLQLGGPQQHLVPIRPPQQSQQSAQVHGQSLFTHSSLPVRPAPVQAMVPNQQNAGLLQPPTNFPPAQQSLYPQTQQPGQIVSPSTIMQPVQQHISQPTSQQPQPPFGGQQLGLNQNQLYQQGPFPQQQMLMQPQMRPQVPTPSHPPQPQQSLQHSHSSQNPVGRLPIPNHGVPFQVSQLGAIQVRPSQPSFNPNNLVVPSSQVQSSSEEHLGSVFQPRMLERSVTNIQTDLSSQNTAKMDEKSLGGNASEINEVKSEMDAKHPVVSSKASENQVACKKQIAKQETAQHEVEPSDAESGKGFLKDQKDFRTSSPKPDGKGILSERENQEGPLWGPLVQQNELFEERIQKDTDLVLEPSGSEKVPAAGPHGADDSRNVPPAGQNTARGVALPPLQQRAAAPPGLPAIPGPPHQLHFQGQPLDQFGHPGSGNLQLRQVNTPYQVPSSFSKQPFEPPIASGGKPGHGSQPPFGRGQGQFQHQFAPQLVPHDHGYLHQRMHFCEPHGEIPPGALDKSGGMFISEKHAPNTGGVEKLTERRPLYMDSRQTDPNLQGTLEQSSWGPTSRTNRPLGVDSPLFLDQEKRFKSLREEHMHASAVNLTRQVYDQRGIQVELKSLHDPIAKHGNQYTSGSRFDSGPFEKAFHGLTTDGAGSTSLRMLPPYGRDVDIGKRPFGPPEDNIERLGSSRMRIDALGLDPSYSRRFMEDSAIRTPGEYDGLPSRSFKGPPGISQGSLGPGDIVRRESRSFGSFPESRFHGLPGHLNKSGFEYPGNLGVGEHLRNGDLMGHGLPSHVRMREFLGPQNLRMGEPGGFGTFHDRTLAGESIVPEVYGGQLGSGRSLSLQGHSTDGYKSNEPFDDLRRRRVTSMGWCRICKVDCETVDGLDLHSQTMGHQKAAMDIVRSIKQQNAKKQKLSSSDKSSVEDRSKSRTPNSEVIGRNH